MSTRPQTYANHRRLPPIAFALVFFVLIAEVVVRMIGLVQLPSPNAGWALLVAVSLLVIAYYARRNSQIVQDRLIRLEMRFRLERLLPVERHGDIARLTLSQLVGLRFASDGELPALMHETLAQSLTNDAIKRKITVWQADWLRV